MDVNLEQYLSYIRNENKSDLEFPLFKGTPIEFQKVGAETAYLAKRLLLMDPVGLGKCIQSLLLISKLIEEYRAGKRKTARILVAVESDHIHQWIDESKRFLGITPQKPVGAKPTRKKKYDLIASRDEVIVVVNHSKLFVDFDWITNRMRPDCFIIDEAAIISNPNKTHKYSTWIAKQCEYILLLTAEPITRGDLVQIRNCMLVLGQTICENEEDFVEKFVVTQDRRIKIRTRFGPMTKIVRKPVGAKNVSEFKDLIFPYALRRKESILGDARIINRQLITVEMAKTMRERYAEVRRRILTTEEGKKEINALSTANYLSQILGSPWVVDESAPQECPKGEALVRLAKKLEPEKLVVFSKWKRMHKLLGKILRKEGVEHILYSGDLTRDDRAAAVTRFKEDPECQLLVMTEVAKKGLNLQVTKNICILDLLYSPASMRQLIGRVDRIGQISNIINLFIIVAEGSSEMNVLKVLRDRQTITDAVFDEEKAEIFNDHFTAEEMLLDV